MRILISSNICLGFYNQHNSLILLPPWHIFMLSLFVMHVLYGLKGICSSSTIKSQWGTLRCQVKFAMLTKAVYQMRAFEKDVLVSLHYTSVQAQSKQCETSHQEKEFPKGFISASISFSLTEKHQISLLKYFVMCLSDHIDF